MVMTFQFLALASIAPRNIRADKIVEMTIDSSLNILDIYMSNKYKHMNLYENFLSSLNLVFVKLLIFFVHFPVE